MPSLDRTAIDSDADRVVRKLTRAGYKAYLVGGCVRDLLVGRTPKDFDVATSATPNEIKATFRNSRIIGRRFRLAHVFFGSKIIETATFRANPRDEDDHDLLIRRDNVFGTEQEDAKRRDFTINGLFYDVEREEVIDHVGGLTQHNVIQFPNAVVHAERDEGDYWLIEKNLANAPDASKAFFKDAVTEVEPYVKAGKFRLFAGAVQLLPGVSSVPSFGHTAGHTSYMIESQGQKLLVMGDLIHVPAVQLDHPNVTISFDTDPKEAAASRIRVFNEMASDKTLVAGAHIPFPGVGHLRASGTSYQWVPVNFTRMRPAQSQPQ